MTAGIQKVSSITNYWYMEGPYLIKNCQRFDRINEALSREYTALVNRKVAIFQHDNKRLQSAKRSQEKVRLLG